MITEEEAKAIARSVGKPTLELRASIVRGGPAADGVELVPNCSDLPDGVNRIASGQDDRPGQFAAPDPRHRF